MCYNPALLNGSVRITTVEDLNSIRDSVQARELGSARGSREQVLLCAGGGCIASGESLVKKALIDTLRKYRLGKRIAVVETGCLGPCAGGPVMIVGSDNTFYQKLTPAAASEIVEKHLAGGTIIDKYTYRQGPDSKSVPSAADIEFFRKQTRIVLRNCGRIDPNSIEDYIGNDGYQAMAKALCFMTPDEVIDQMKRSGLRGRGGAGFPTGQKWEYASRSPGPVKYILCNADEGDPGAYMDRSVLEGDPHSIIEGMIIGAFAIGAEQGYVYVRAEYPLAVIRLQNAIESARGAGILGKNILQSGFSFDLEIRMGSGAFVCGEETALMASIEGRRGEPRPRPPFPAQQGLWNKPTVLNNVETFANVPVIILNGSDEFAKTGTAKSKGTKVFALAGAINQTGLVEVPVGISLADVVYEIGGGIPRGKSFKAAQLGGPSGGCIPLNHINVPLDYDSLIELGAIMGSGGLIVMDEDTCMVDVARFFLDFVQDESCGKCSPCREGTRRMLQILERISNGHGREGDVELLIAIGKHIKSTALCGLGQTAPNPVLSTIRYFRHEYDAHIRGHQCPAGVCKGLTRAPCQSACPAHVDIPGYISLIGEKRYKEALNLHRERNPFASVCARVCFHTCENRCRRSSIDQPVAIRSLKRFLIEQEKAPVVPVVKSNDTNAERKIAIIGAGPAGLTCAYFLARLGYNPRIFEAAQKPGGMLIQAIPAYRLPRNILAREVKMIMDLGVKIEYGRNFGRDISLESLKDEGYDAICIAAGTPSGITPSISGVGSHGVVEALDFLRQFNMTGKAEIGKKVVVVGGGNAAIDAARTALRLGARVSIVYRRTREEMPAYAEEIQEAEREGVRIITLVNPVEVITANGSVKGLRCEKMRPGAFDSSGRRSPFGSGETIFLRTDKVIFALGQRLDTKTIFPGLSPETEQSQRIIADPVNGRTSIPWIFAAGDAVSGPSSVVEAIGAGERAAVGIDAFFTGESHAFWRTEHENITYFDPDADPSDSRRANVKLLRPVERKAGFIEVELSWSEKVAIAQAQRCMRCDYGKASSTG